jgi:hypothetical protein
MLTPRQKSEKNNLEMTNFIRKAYDGPKDLISKAVGSEFVGNKIRSAFLSGKVLSAGVGVAALFVYLKTGLPISETLPYFEDLKDSSRLGVFADSIMDSFNMLDKDAITEALKEGDLPALLNLMTNISMPAIDMSAISEAGKTLSDNKELGIFLLTVTTAANYTLGYLNSDNGMRGAKLADGSALNLYKEHLQKFDVSKQFKPGNSRNTHFTGQGAIFIQRAVSALRTTWLGQVFGGNKRDKYTQAEVDCLQNLVFMELAKDCHPKIMEARSHRAYDHPVFEAIFKNAETLSQKLIPNIENYSQFSRSMYRSLSGLENDIFDLDPALGKNTNDAKVINQFNTLVLDALQAAYAEADQRKVIEHSIGQISEEISDLIEQYPDGKVEDFQAEHLLKMLSVASQSLMEFDKNHPETIYAPLYKQYNVMQEKLRVAITQGRGKALSHGAHTAFVDLTKTPGIQVWCQAPLPKNNDNSEAVSFIWKEVFGKDAIQNPTVDGVASAKLMTEIREMALHRADGVGNKADDVAVELGKRATFEYSVHNPRKQTQGR